MQPRELSPKEWEKIELYLKAGATQKRIAESLSITIENLQLCIKQRYGEPCHTIVSKFRSQGELLLEATQFQRALAGNIPMLLWLGKVRLGQREPDLLDNIPPAQDTIDKDHTIMKLQHHIDQLQERLAKYGHKPETK